MLKYTQEWRAYVTRQARWVDFDNDYKTLDLTFMESVIWAFKQLWDKGLAYEGYRVLPYCWNDETPLSSHELRMDDDVYQSRQDPAITVGFRITERPAARMRTSSSGRRPRGRCRPTRRSQSIATSTTCSCRRGIAATCWRRRDWPPTRESWAKNPRSWPPTRAANSLARTICRRLRISWTRPTVFRYCTESMSSTEDGTGIVHMSPAYGEEDMATVTPAGIVAVTPVDAKGRFDETVPDYVGQHVFDANPQIIRDLKNESGPPRTTPRCYCDTRPTSTPTRTAGAAETR